MQQCFQTACFVKNLCNQYDFLLFHTKNDFLLSGKSLNLSGMARRPARTSKTFTSHRTRPGWTYVWWRILTIVAGPRRINELFICCVLPNQLLCRRFQIFRAILLKQNSFPHSKLHAHIWGTWYKAVTRSTCSIQLECYFKKPVLPTFHTMFFCTSVLLCETESRTVDTKCLFSWMKAQVIATSGLNYSLNNIPGWLKIAQMVQFIN